MTDILLQRVQTCKSFYYPYTARMAILNPTALRMVKLYGVLAVLSAIGLRKEEAVWSGSALIVKTHPSQLWEFLHWSPGDCKAVLTRWHILYDTCHSKCWCVNTQDYTNLLHATCLAWHIYLATWNVLPCKHTLTLLHSGQPKLFWVQ